MNKKIIFPKKFLTQNPKKITFSTKIHSISPPQTAESSEKEKDHKPIAKEKNPTQKKISNRILTPPKLISPIFFNSKSEETKLGFPSLADQLNSIKISNINIKNDEIQPKVIKEKICIKRLLLRNKRGRQVPFPFNSLKRFSYHGANNFDNLHRKIQVGFFSFLINLANDVIKGFFGGRTHQRFKHINYKDKISINYENSQNLMKCSYSDILKLKLSAKYTNFSEDHNEKTLAIIHKKSPQLKEFFEQNYLYIFKKYFYNDLKPLKEIELNNIIIKLSEKTKSFCKILKEKNNKINYEKLINVAETVYLNNKIEKGEKILFLTKKVDKKENLEKKEVNGK